MDFSDLMRLKGRRFVVAGLGESGLAMTKWLLSEGASVRVADNRAEPPGLAALRDFAPDTEISLGAFSAQTFRNADAIALSPGLAPNTPGVAASGLEIISEVDFFMSALEDHCPESSVLAITGSNGKTTTTALTAHLLNGAGRRAVACGNISPSLLDALMTAKKSGVLPEFWVTELSSFQLESARYLPVTAATVLNISADHLDRHANLFAYAQAKARIFRGGAAQILNRDDDWSLGMGGCEHFTTFGLTPPPREGHYGLENEAIYLGRERLMALADVPLPGLHNAANLMAALALCRAVDVPAESALPALASFTGLPHRVETVAVVADVTYIDDSKGTNVGATLAALEGLGAAKKQGKIALILGGDGKGQNFTSLSGSLARHGRAAALIGKDADKIAADIAGCGILTRRFDSLEDATRWLASQSLPGDSVLLSPACASWDMFRDYAHRAEVFREVVRSLASPGEKTGRDRA
ncbi:MAG: UDP-N-acetylmuramoyl-L-alanine--D-glutamate ligase [Zoogloeaceae bacterium]|jgi:UDP-N-acetylmuramoylalanine--D-glutamate ligase|nr:UDP-N-acetylmuramoyl-L-alanine--D-glutamate ligase [Zoogloeaceae bacterium]